jgi:hypothetical protein
MKVAYQTVALFWACATAGTEEVAAVPWFGSEAAALVTLRTAVDF